MRQWCWRSRPNRPCPSARLAGTELNDPEGTMRPPPTLIAAPAHCRGRCFLPLPLNADPDSRGPAPKRQRNQTT